MNNYYLDYYSLLNELKYDSIMLFRLCNKNKNELYNIYGNMWLLCNVVNGVLNVVQTGTCKADLEELGFQVVYNGIFNVFNPELAINHNKRRCCRDIVKK